MRAGPKRGRPASATRDEVLRLVRQQYLKGQRVDLALVARSLGLSRATLYRWFGSREAVLGEVIAHELELMVARAREHTSRRGGEGLLDIFDQINRGLAGAVPLRRLLEQERDPALRLLTSSSGAVQPRAVALVESLIEAEVAAGEFVAPADPGTLAYAIVRLAEAFLYNDAAAGLRGDHERLREVEAALLGVRA